MPVVEFFFTDEQRTRAKAEGDRRQTFNEQRGTRGRNKAPGKGAAAQAMHQLGAAAEVAVAAFLDAEDYLFLDESPVRGSCDLPGIDVKCRSNHTYDLLVQLDDDLSKTYVLVTIQNKRTYIHGFIPGIEVPAVGVVKEFVPKRPCYAIPQSSLKSMDLLKKIYKPAAVAQ
jgi:hypothetical protein